jgi:GxxExxY protein
MEKWGKEELTEKIIGACIRVHKALGPGFLENVYLNALLIELRKIGLACESEKEIRVLYEGALVGIHKIDLFVEGVVIVELKAVEDLNKRHYAQLRSCLSALHCPHGLLVNFASYKLDVRRVVLDKRGV